MWEVTENKWLAASAEWVVAKPLAILAILLVAFLLRWLARRLIDRITRIKAGPMNAGRQQRAQTIGSVLRSVATFVIFGIAVMQILSVLGVNLAPILASAGIAGVALGFGAQNLVKDFLSGLFMMAEDQYGVGDTVDLGDANGTVEAVGLRITTLRDSAGTVWYVRNGEVLRVGNSSQGYANAVVNVLLAPGSDIGRASRVIEDTATEVTTEEPLSADVLEPPQLLGVDSVTAEGIVLQLTVKVKAGTQYGAQRALRGRIATALADAGFDSPALRMLAPPPSSGKG